MAKKAKEFPFSHSQCTIFKYQFSTLQNNYVATFKVLVGKIGQVLQIETSNLAIKQPTKPLVTFKVVNIIQLPCNIYIPLVDINDPIDAIFFN